VHRTTASRRTLPPDTLTVPAARPRRIPVRVCHPAAPGGTARTMPIHRHAAQKYDRAGFDSYVLLHAPPLVARGARTPRAHATRARHARTPRDSALAVKAATYRATVETTRAFRDEAPGVVGRGPD
jgi:hypothetical protein